MTIRLSIISLLLMLLSGCALPPPQKAETIEEYCLAATDLAHAVAFEKSKGLPRAAIHFVPQSELPQKELDRIEQVIDWVYEGAAFDEIERRCLAWRR